MEKIPEAFLHYIWQHRLFNEQDLKSSAGTTVQVLDPGVLNTDSGPDFFNARIRIGDTLWAGDIEIHVHASDWVRHRHQDDPAYNSVILHAVAFNDCQVTRKDGAPVPTLRLTYERSILKRYNKLLQNEGWIACENELASLPSIFITQWITRLGIERLMNKSLQNRERIQKYSNDWEFLLHVMIAESFGIPVNAFPFALLAERLSLGLLLKYRESLFTLEALLFGHAGFLDQLVPEDQYMRELSMEYDRLKERISGQALPSHLWKFMRLRPASFPTLRLAQLAELIRQHYPLLAKVSADPSLRNLRSIFSLRAGDYWNTHYHFGKQTEFSLKSTGKSMVDRIIINALVPFLFMYGKAHGREDLCTSAISLLEQLAPEKNRIIKKWTTFGIRPVSAFESQSLLELYRSYCCEKRCHTCQFGVKLIAGISNEGT